MKNISVTDIEPYIAAHNGNVAAIARHFGVARGTIQKRIDSSPALLVALEDAREGMTDNAESALYKQILDGNITAIIFYLKTRAKKRGYVERTELTGADGGPIAHASSDIDAELASLCAEVARLEKATGDSVPEGTSGNIALDSSPAVPQTAEVPSA
jgi:hypothetical protein